MTPSRLTLLALALLLSSAATATQSAAPAGDPNDPLLVRAKNIEVRRSQFELEKKSLPPDQRHLLSTDMNRIQRTIERLVVNNALIHEANQTGFDQKPEVKAELEYTLRQKLAQMYLSHLASQIQYPDLEPALQERYRLEKDKYQEPERVRASHILISTKNRTKEEALARANEVREKAIKGEDFKQLVKQYSDDPTARRNDGDLNYFPYEQMVPEFSAAAFALKKEGDISPAVETSFGYHIIRFVDRRAARTKSYEELRPTFLEEAQKNYQAQFNRQKLEQLITLEKPEVNMSEVNKLLDQKALEEARQKNELFKKEIERSLTKQ
jgi:peptidyl-prolyl cis-trans isomerase C